MIFLLLEVVLEGLGSQNLNTLGLVFLPLTSAYSGHLPSFNFQLSLFEFYLFSFFLFLYMLLVMQKRHMKTCKIGVFSEESLCIFFLEKFETKENAGMRLNDCK